MQNSDYLRSLTLCELEITEDVIITDIAPRLLQCKLFTTEDMEIVNHEITGQAKSRKLLEIIRQRDDELFEHFREILRDTNEEIAELLFETKNIRTRRMSNTSFGDILVKGGVPDRTSDYVQRRHIERKILDYLKSNNSKPLKPLLIHGVVGCGKTTLVSNTLYTDEIFPEQFIKCCWVSVGNIKEEDVIKKLSVLLNKLDPSKTLSANTFPEIYTETIRQLLIDTTTLVILDDIWDENIMRHFLFQCKYIVSSGNANLLPNYFDRSIEIPDHFERKECIQILDCHDIDSTLHSKIIEKSGGIPFQLSIICELLKSNSDFKSMISKIDFNQHTNMLHMYSKILDDYQISKRSVREYFEMLVILGKNETISLKVLSIYWNLPESEAIIIINRLYDYHFMQRSWNESLKCNMHELYNIYQEYLSSSQAADVKKGYEDLLVQRHFDKYKSWLDIDYPDPFFLIFYPKKLYNDEKKEELEKLYMDFSFLAAKIVTCGINELHYDFQRYRPCISDSNWNSFESFFMKYSHKFNTIPEGSQVSITVKKVHRTLIQLGLYEMKESSTFKMASQPANLKGDFWNWINPEPSIKKWEMSFGDSIDYFDVSKDFIIIANGNGRICLLDSINGKCIFDYKTPDPLRLVQFINDYEFLMIDSSNKARKCSLSQFSTNLQRISSRDDEDDFDCQDYLPDESIDIDPLIMQFRNLSMTEFDAKCDNYSIKNSITKNEKFQAVLLDTSILFLNYNGTETYVAICALDFQMREDFKVSFAIKKIRQIQNYYYALRRDSGVIVKIDEFGCPGDEITIANNVIVDFEVKDYEIFYAVSKSVYKHLQVLFSISKEAHIEKIAVSKDKDLLALCLTDSNIQIWDHVEKRLMYSLNDSQFSDVSFLQHVDYIMTFGETNVAKWEIGALHSRNNNNNNAQSYSSTHYRRHFGLFPWNSSYLLVLQTLENNLEFRLIERDHPKITICNEKLKASCFQLYKDHVFIGFKDNGIKIFDVKSFSLVSTLETEVTTNKCSVKNLQVFEIDVETLGIAVHCLTNEITVISLNSKTFSVTFRDKPELPGQISVCNLLKMNSNQIMLAISSIGTCFIYKIERNKLVQKDSLSVRHNILDVDISTDEQYICVITEKGQFTIKQLNNDKKLTDKLDEGKILRKCKFRPKKLPGDWNLVAIINDEAAISLIYFLNEKIVINSLDDSSTVARQLPQLLIWSPDSDYLLVGDYGIRKFKIRGNPINNKQSIKLPLTNLPTYYGGICQIQMVGDLICTVDQQGFLYLLKKLSG